jgi:outer membrane protein
MLNRFILSLFLSLFIPELGAHTLKEAFEAARLNMESIKRAEAMVSQSEELKTQARAAILPTLSGVGSYTRIDPPKSTGSNSPFLLTRQYVAALRLTQPLIRGGSLAGHKLARENHLLMKFQKDSTELNLYQLVLEAYFMLASTQMDVKNLDELLKFSRERVKEISDRTAIGRSRKGELVEAQAQLHIAESQYNQALLSLGSAEENFEFLTKLKPLPVILSTSVPVVQTPLNELLSKALTRPDVMVRGQEVRVAEQQVTIAKGGHYPSLDLTSNYYFDRTGILETSNWDVGLALVVPFFQGGSVSSQVREAVEGKRIAELNRSETLRTAQRDIHISYQNLIQIHAQLKALNEAMRKSQEGYLLNKKDYQFGLVTNLDVLQSLNIYIETKRTFDGLVSAGHLNYKNLEALTGVLP